MQFYSEKLKQYRKQFLSNMIFVNKHTKKQIFIKSPNLVVIDSSQSNIVH